MRSKYLILALVVVSVFGVTYYDYLEKKKIASFWESNQGVCEVGKGCSDVKVRPGYGVGDTIPNVTLYTPSGEKVKLYDLVKGKKNIYLNLGTDWCPDCIAERETFPKLFSALNEDTIIIPIFVVYKSDRTNIEQIKEYIKSQNFDFPVYIDVNNDLLHRFKVNGTPTNVYIDKTGRIKVIAQEQSLDKLMIYTLNEGE